MLSKTETYGKERLLALDLLRAVAAMIVALGHTGVVLPARSGITYSMCVAFFFILSGFVLAHAYGNAIEKGGLSFRNFFVLRLARLYPLHAATAIATIVLLIARGRQSEITPLGILENIVATQSLITNNWSLNAPAWSLGPEFLGSILVFGLCTHNRQLRLALVVLTLALFFVVEFRSGFLLSTRNRYWIGLGCFLFGWASHRYIDCRLLSRIPAFLPYLLAFSAFAATIFCPAAIAQSPLGEICFYVLFILVVLTVAQVHLQGWQANVAEFFGNISYGIYLWHWLILIVAPPTSLKGAAIFLALLILLSWASYTMFERPAKNMIRGALYTKPRAAAPTPL